LLKQFRLKTKVYTLPLENQRPSSKDEGLEIGLKAGCVDESIYISSSSDEGVERPLIRGSTRHQDPRVCGCFAALREGDELLIETLQTFAEAIPPKDEGLYPAPGKLIVNMNHIILLLFQH